MTSPSAIAYLSEAYLGLAAIQEAASLAQLTAVAGELALQRSDARAVGEDLLQLAESGQLGPLQARWQEIARSEEPTLRLFSPLVVARGTTGFSPTQLLLSEIPEGFRWADDASLVKAMGERGVRDKVRIANALQLQADVWRRIQELRASGHRVGKEDGALLTSRGDWEVFFSLLLQQAGVLGGGHPLFAGFLTKPEEHDEVDALLMTAGFHPRFGDVTDTERRLRATSPLVMFPPDARDDLLRGFELFLWNPTGDTMGTLLPADLGGMTGDLVVAGATKAVGSAGDARGLIITDKVKALRHAVAERHLKFAFVGGYTGAEAIVRRGDVPYQEEIQSQGLHLVLGVNDAETERFWGEYLTGTTESQEIEEGGKRYRRYQNNLLAIPVIVDIVSDPVLGDAQAAAAVWKNVCSIILGRALFNLIYERIDKKAFDNDGDLAIFLAGGRDSKGRDHGKGKYQEMMDEMVDVVRETLIEVEGFRPEDALIVKGVLKDLYSSWGVREMGTLVAIVRDVFFSRKEGEALKGAVERAKGRLDKALSTRNPRGGFGVGMGVRLVLFGKTSSLWDAVPRRQYEGRTTLRLIGARLEFLAAQRGMTVDELRRRLPDQITAMAETVLENVTPNMIPNATRKVLGDFTSALGRISSGTPLSRNLAAALLGRPVPEVGPDDIDRLQRIRQIAHLDDLKAIVAVLTGHVRHAMALIHDLGEYQAEGAGHLIEHLDGMARTLEYVNARILIPDQTANLDSQGIMRVLAAVKAMVDQIDHLNHGFDIARVAQATSLHLIQIVRFIRGEIPSPAILAGDPPIEVPPEYRRFLPEATPA